MDTRRKLNVHKTFRRRPRRLLNVLCTFNLRPVSRSYSGWETGICQSGDCFSDLCNFWEAVKNLENGFKIFKFSCFIKLSARAQLEKDTVEDFFL